MKKIITIFNQAGGVGKTTLTQNVGLHLSQKGYRVLLVDLDPQASLTAFMGLEPFELEQQETLARFLLKESSDWNLEDFSIVQRMNGVDLLPSNIELSPIEPQLSGRSFSEFILRQILELIPERYDFVLCDCPPSLGKLSIMGLTAATDVLIPIQTQYKATKGTEALFRTLKMVKLGGNSGLRMLGFVPFLFDARRSLDKEVLSSIHNKLSSVATVFSTVPNAADIAASSRDAIGLYQKNPRHRAVKVFDQIANTIVEQENLPKVA